MLAWWVNNYIVQMSYHFYFDGLVFFKTSRDEAYFASRATITTTP